MRFHPQYVPNSPKSPMQVNLTGAIKSNEGFGNAGRMNETIRKVRAGEKHPALTFDKVAVGAREHGATWMWACGLLCAVRTSLATIWGKLPDVSDPHAAHVSETDAECESNRLQARVFGDITKARESDITAFLNAKEVEMYEDERIVLICTAELLRREKAAAHAHLTLHRGA